MMAKVNLRYVIKRTNKYKRTYYYFRRSKQAKLIPLPGAPGSVEFSMRYDELMATVAPPKVRRLRRGDHGTLAWVIERYMAPDNPAWSDLEPTTQEVYRRRFDWLRERYGSVSLAVFTARDMRRIRDQLKDKPTVANAVVDKFGQLWRWAVEHADLELTDDPTLSVAALKVKGEAARAWTPELCAKFEACPHRQMVLFYFLARYTGQRRGDVCKMLWSDYSAVTRKIHVVQEKTGTKLWVPAHKRLREYLATLPRVEGDADTTILKSPRGGAYRKTSISALINGICTELGFKGYSPHGLRHLCGASLAQAGCNVPQIMSVLGQLSERQAQHYVKQANRVLMSEDAVTAWEEMDERDSSVTRLRPKRGQA
jgi:integrase